MSTISIKEFAKQIGVEPEKLISQLAEAGMKGKDVADSMSDEEKRSLLTHLRGDIVQRKDSGKITLKRKTTSEIRQKSRTGTTRTVQVEVRKRRTFVAREVIEKQEEDRVAAVEAERAAEEAVKREAEDAIKREQAEKERIAREAEEAVLKEQQDAEKIAEAAAQQEEMVEEVEAAADAVEEPAAEEPAVKTAQTEAKTEVKPAVGPAAAKKADAKPASPANAREGKKKGNRGGRAKLHVSHARKKRQDRARTRRIVSSETEKHTFEKPTAPVIHKVEVPETIGVGELAAAMSIKGTEVVKVLMQMGTMVTINQTLDQDTAMLIVEEMGHEAVVAEARDPEAFLQAKEPEVDNSNLQPRCPVVTIMGHVDHGKTSLLDYIRKSRVAAGEAGGITQHIGAYQVETDKGLITFLDTPGHEAFSSMRLRGAQATDIVILVVAGDDGVKPQTIEAIKHTRSAGVPMLVAINKMDKEESDPERVKQELSAQEVIPEDWGGDVMMLPVSAETGEGIDALLDAIILQAEIMELTARPDGPATGVVIEARLDRGRGAVATILVQQGQLQPGDTLLAGRETARVRAISDYAGKPLKVAGPSTPVEIQGLAGVPLAGDDVFVVSDERKAREVAEFRQQQHRETRMARQQAAKLENMFQQMGEGDVQTVNVLIKSDVQGSLEALSESLQKLSTEQVRVNVVHGLVGGINESDVNLAMAASALMIGFNVRADATARRLSESENVEIRYYSVIYDVVDDIKTAMVGMLAPIIRENIIGYVEVKDVFRAPKIGSIAGCFVTEGTARRNAKVRVLRDDVVIFEGKIDSMRRFKDDVSEVKAGTECGIGIVNYNDIKVGDQFEMFEETEHEATLE
jgi:translation initiation factor IF-2